MNEQERDLFYKLSKDREENAHVLSKQSMLGVQESVVEKYSDQAHFVYELLQNADDVKATTAKFLLTPNSLLYIHNGKRRFSISDPNNEREDSVSGILGDINSITSIGNSNKTKASIGKFGVGFKAVFQYTKTPHIYDDNFRFKITDFIVPKMIDDDIPGRAEGETMFLLPFDTAKRSPEIAYSEISNRLEHLLYPQLFLSHLETISFQIGDRNGCYKKTIKEKSLFDDVTAEFIALTTEINSEQTEECLWLFSRTDEENHKYSIGFFVDAEGNLRPANNIPAFCFFATTVNTHLNFIIHAPFLLTDSREGIVAGNKHNEKMIQNLANLAADSLSLLKEIGEQKKQRLIDDNILEIIPYNPESFSSIYGSQISFKPFYNSILNLFKEKEIIPSNDGYAVSKNAYWASVQNLATLFSNEQLGMICDNENAKWVFTTKGRDSIADNNNILSQYIDSIVETNIDDETIIKGRGHSIDYFYNRYTRGYQSVKKIRGITPEFIENQPVSWLYKFYSWLYESRVRTNWVKTRSFFLNKDRKAVAAYDEDNHLILFLPLENMSGYEFVSSELLADENTRLFIESIGVKEPSQKDYIYNVILPKYRNNTEDINPVDDFRTLFDYYCNCRKEDARYLIDDIKGLRFLQCYCEGSMSRNVGEKMYLPCFSLKSYFAAKPNTLFVALKDYQMLVGESRNEELLIFLDELGVRKSIPVLDFKQTINPSDINKTGFTGLYRKDLPVPDPYPRQSYSYTEKYIDGCKEYLDYIIANPDKSKSIMLWDILIDVINRECEDDISLSNRLIGVCEWRYHKKLYSKGYISLDELSLKSCAWLVDRNGVFHRPEELTVFDLSEEYQQTSNAARKLIDFLGISSSSSEDSMSEDLDSNLTERQREDIELGRFARENGLTKENLEEFRKYKRQMENNKRTDDETYSARSTQNVETSIDDQQKRNVENDQKQEDDSPKDVDAFDLEHEFDAEGNNKEVNDSEAQNRPRVSRRTVSVMKDIAEQMQKTVKETSIPSDAAEEDVDQDEYIPRKVDYQQRIDHEKQKSAFAIRQIEYMEDLQKRAAEALKYSFGWFKALLEMECINSAEANSNSREISIEFSVVEREPGTQRTLVLKHPNRYIPQFMEDIADIPLVLHMDDTIKKVEIEVSNIKSYTLRVKLKNPDDINEIDLSSVRSATIEAQSPVFLLEELRRQFEKMGFPDDYNMQNNLCRNIEFIFGPPGTGKTTYLARQVLVPMMCNTDDKKVLVLTPTNKAADVLTRRIMDEFKEDLSYEKWLIRFGMTGDETIEKSPVFKDKTFDIRSFHRNVTVTTIARFPYDFFMPGGDRLHLRELHWDYIVIDEASMIPLVNIIYPLYKKTPQAFIIAGDPFQIQPITAVDLWKDENIYSIVHLDSFQNPNTFPHKYKIRNLSTQYRSIPEIGRIFSQFAYDGVLKHNRTSESRISLNLGDNWNIEPMNILKFPVSKYESVYRTKRLQHRSAYQIYSALFTYEYVCFLSKQLAENNPDKVFKIGIIAPYRAQSDLIEKLMASRKKLETVDVQVGTIHGFQGDECDIIFSIFNSPPVISRSPDMFLNNRNIINVSISRARDYLFIVMPDDKTENVSNLYRVKQVERLVKQSDSWTEMLTPEIEQMMFGDSNYLENNAFSTSHQNVNVYGLPEKIYEVRTEENAVDIQVHNPIRI